MISRQRAFITAALLAFLSTGNLHASPPIDCSETLRKIAEKHVLMPGLVGAIVDGDHVTAIGSIGIRKEGSPEKFTVDDVIHLGSDTKAMTAVLVGQLIASKQVTFGETMADVFPGLKMNPAMAQVTIAQVMQHVAGLPANLDWWELDRSGLSLVDQRKKAVEQMLSRNPDYPPGTKYLYSNAGYVLLGAIVEKTTGQPWETSIQKKLFDPLSMTTAGFGPPGTIGKIDQPWGHSFYGDVFGPNQFANAPVMGPAGRVHCSISDWAKFVSLFLHDPDVMAKHGDVLSEAMGTALTTPGKTGEYMGGWLMTRRAWGEGIVLNHAGSNTTWYCVAWVSPKKHFATLVATNYYSPDAEKLCDEISGELIRMHKKLANVQAVNPN